MKTTKQDLLRPRVRTKEIRPAPERIQVAATTRPFAILVYAHESCAALIEAFSAVREKRGASGPGAPTDEEQDLLRAMLVFATAGLDSMLKQVIRDCLPELVNVDTAAADQFQTFAARRLRGGGGDANAPLSSDTLARALLSRDPARWLLEAYVQDLTGSSLQSVGELKRVARALGVEPKELAVGDDVLKPAFEARNQIVHEMDIDFRHPNRNRRSRKKPDMIAHTNAILEASDAVLLAVTEKLAAGC